MAEYRRNYEKHLGCPIPTPFIQVHHIDGNRRNNDISNLVAIPRKLHSDYHAILPELENAKIWAKNTHMPMLPINSIDFITDRINDIFKEEGYYSLHLANYLKEQAQRIEIFFQARDMHEKCTKELLVIEQKYNELQSAILEHKKIQDLVAQNKDFKLLKFYEHV